ncbi:hypothetical protein [Pyrococcus yayanosii]|uniref:Uncharacterized protein n=1 Tax=Pyrococcus yayanosii (strain CH1 / JCM 16557) TaxID=529709 RepID=F8AIZ2_PYRYC|nr:hypothetical protein [Pyrococcus yayanosii]AEH24468.1 hypothetical protein PYCH_07830 [Pyrococcus yayanosii CH1]
MSQRVNVQFPEIEGTPQMLIIKRYPLRKQSEDSESTNKRYRYLFYPAEITDDVAENLKEILSNYISMTLNTQGENNLPSYHPDIDELPCYVELTSENFPYWQDFVEVLKLDSDSRQERAPKTLETNLWGYLFYLRSENYAIGYAKKLSKSKVLKKKKLLKGGLVHRGILFNSVEEIEGIELDISTDFIFVVKFDQEDNPTQSWGIIWNKSNFEALLDVYEYQKEKAMGILGQCRTLPQLLSEEDLANLKATVEGNRQLHKMLLNPVTAKYMNEVTINDFKEVKKKFRDVSFDIDENNQKVLLPSPNSEEYIKAVREVLSIIGARFGKTMNNQHIFKGKPEEIR